MQKWKKRDAAPHVVPVARVRAAGNAMRRAAAAGRARAKRSAMPGCKVQRLPQKEKERKKGGEKGGEEKKLQEHTRRGRGGTGHCGHGLVQ